MIKIKNSTKIPPREARNPQFWRVSLGQSCQSRIQHRLCRSKVLESFHLTHTLCAGDAYNPLVFEIYRSVRKQRSPAVRVVVTINVWDLLFICTWQSAHPFKRQNLIRVLQNRVDWRPKAFSFLFGVVHQFRWILIFVWAMTTIYKHC